MNIGKDSKFSGWDYKDSLAFPEKEAIDYNDFIELYPELII